jgi:hypothetical protein
MRHIVGLSAAGLVFVVLFKGFFRSFWRKPPSKSDSPAPDWSVYNDGASIDTPSEHNGNL